MPKKRHQPIFSKPQSPAPSALGRSSAATGSSSRFGSNHEGKRSVNEILANLRRLDLASAPRTGPETEPVAPSVPPQIRRLLQLPEPVAPRPRRPPRRDANGRRLPAGPPPPRSWLVQADWRRYTVPRRTVDRGRHAFPGAYKPDSGSLVHLCLRALAAEWDLHAEYNKHYLHTLPAHLKSALIAYLGIYTGRGVSLADLKIILQPSKDEDYLALVGGDADADVVADATENEGFRYLDLTGSVGRSVKIKELADLLFPPVPEDNGELEESWEVAEACSVPRRLLPSITHLSLAVDPDNASPVSWKQLLSLAANLSTLTHLSLAYWPEPSLTPNAKYTSVVSPQGKLIQYSGTGPYSHSLDNDWSEAIMVLKRLSKCLYSLEYLELTGCFAWFPALMHDSDHDFVDWVGHWGKISTLLLYSGFEVTEDSPIAETTRYREVNTTAKQVEKHIRSQRAGRGRIITVEKDDIPAFYNRLGASI